MADINVLSDLPSVSVVIPTHNRLPVLRQCLAALAAQTFPPDRFEVVVVADGCSDGTEAALAEASFPFALHVLSQSGSGAGAARNRGAEEARGELLLFIDDDVIASPGLVAAHVSAHAGAEESVAVGPYLLERGNGLFSEQLCAWWHKTFDAMAAPHFVPDYRSVLGGNLSILAATFHRVGGFDARFRYSNEDYEFGHRLLTGGVRFVFAAGAQARHLETTDLARSLERIRRQGSADVLFAELHPSVAPTLSFTHPHRLSQWLVYRAPRLGERTARGVTQLMRVAEHVGAHRLWMRLGRRLKYYWYWRGVAEQVGNRDEWAEYRSRLDEAHQATRVTTLPTSSVPEASSVTP